MSEEDIVPPCSVLMRIQYIKHIYSNMTGASEIRKQQIESDKQVALRRGEKPDEDPLFTSKERAIFLATNKRNH